MPIHIPPSLELEKIGDVTLLRTEELILEGKTEKLASLTIKLRPVLSPALSPALSLVPSRGESIRSKANRNGHFQMSVGLRNLRPGLQYEVRVSAETDGVSSKEIEVGKISLVEVAPYYSSSPKCSEAIVLVRAPETVKVAVDGVETPSNTLPTRVLRITQPGKHILTLNEKRTMLCGVIIFLDGFVAFPFTFPVFPL